MKHAARQNEQRENKQQRTERLYSGTSLVSQLGLRLDSNPFQIEFLPKFNLLRVPLIQAGCLGKRPTGEVNTAGLGVWWVGEAEIKWTCIVSDGRVLKVCLAKSGHSVCWLVSHLSCRTVTFHSTGEKKKERNVIFSMNWKKRKHARRTLLVIQVMTRSSQQGGGEPRTTRETNSYLPRLDSGHCFRPDCWHWLTQNLPSALVCPPKQTTCTWKDSSCCFVNKLSSQWNSSALLDKLAKGSYAVLLAFGGKKQTKLPNTPNKNFYFHLATLLFLLNYHLFPQAGPWQIKMVLLANAKPKYFQFVHKKSA